MSKIEIGKTYTTRNGLVTSPIRRRDNESRYILEAEVDEYPGTAKTVACWKRDGSFLLADIEHRLDLILPE